MTIHRVSIKKLQGLLRYCDTEWGTTTDMSEEKMG
jgi:hypothetical protein